MFWRYSSPAIDPAPSVPSSMARRSASRQPSFTRAVTRYLMGLFQCTMRNAQCTTASRPILRRQPLPLPASAFADIAQPIVQPALATLPELELLGQHAVPAPPGGPRHRVAVELPRDAESRLERRPALDHLALMGRIHAPAALERARREVRVRLGLAHLLHGAADAHLPLDRRPEEQQRRAAVLRQLARLAAVVVRVEHEAALVNALKEHRAGRRVAVGRGSGQGHRVRIDLQLPRLSEPPRELPEWIGIRLGLAERLALVLATEIGE